MISYNSPQPEPYPGPAIGGAADQSVNVCVERLDRLGVQLQQTSSQIETAVVDVCDSFNSIADKARAETDRLVSLLDPNLKQDDSKPFESLLQSCSRILVRLLETQSKSHIMISNTVNRLRTIDESASKIEKVLTQLDQISSGNRLLALNARIEAAHSPQQERGFKAVAVELAAQTDRSNDLTNNVGDLSKFLRDLADSAVCDLERMQAENEQSTASMRLEANLTLEDLSSAYKKMRDAVNQSQKESALLADDIAEAIRGMQFQDRVSQQIAHVVHDLKVVQQRIAKSSGGMDDDAASPPEFSAFVMHEERAVHGSFGEESAEGDIELF